MSLGDERGDGARGLARGAGGAPVRDRAAAAGGAQPDGLGVLRQELGVLAGQEGVGLLAPAVGLQAAVGGAGLRTSWGGACWSSPPGVLFREEERLAGGAEGAGRAGAGLRDEGLVVGLPGRPGEVVGQVGRRRSAGMSWSR
jgi:hypothetical protein